MDDRIVQVGIEVDGKMNVYEGAAMWISGTKFANQLQNECTVKIANLRADVRNYILTQTSPWKADGKKKRLFVRVGRVSSGVSQIFEGDIVSATPSQPPDISLTIKALTGNFNKLEVISKMSAEKVALRKLATEIAGDLALTLDFQASDKLIENFTFTGGKGKMIDRLMETGNIDAYVDDNKLIVKDFGVAISGEAKILSENTDMVGIPEITETGVRVRMMIDNKVKLGGAIEIQSEINPAANGVYSIFKLGFEIASRDTPFYYIADASNANIKSIIQKQKDAQKKAAANGSK